MKVVDFEKYTDPDILKNNNLVHDHAKSYSEATGNSYFGTITNLINDYAYVPVFNIVNNIGSSLYSLVWGGKRRLHFLKHKSKKKHLLKEKFKRNFKI